MGKWSNSYLFFRRTLKWDIKEYSTYITAYGLLGMVATYLLMPFLTDYLKLRDTTILMVRLKLGSFGFLPTFYALATDILYFFTPFNQ